MKFSALARSDAQAGKLICGRKKKIYGKIGFCVSHVIWSHVFANNHNQDDPSHQCKHLVHDVMLTTKPCEQKGKFRRRPKDHFLLCISKRKIEMVKLGNKSDDSNYSLNTVKFQLKDVAC